VIGRHVTNGTERSATRSPNTPGAITSLDRDDPLLEFDRDDIGDCLNRPRYKKILAEPEVLEGGASARDGEDAHDG
jgi:hypothetical protein